LREVPHPPERADLAQLRGADGDGVEEFFNRPNVFFVARVNSQVWVGDKVVIEERYLHICAFDKSKPD
jgi:hypothetical protein